MANGQGGTHGVDVLEIVDRMVIRFAIECARILFHLIGDRIVSVIHLINAYVHRISPVWEQQLMAVGANGQNGRIARITVLMDTNPGRAPANGGAPCFGSDFELLPCGDPSLCLKSVNGGWAEWSSWTDCSAPCGFAFQSRHRLCNKPKPVARGEPCYGLAYMTSICRTDFCKGSVDGQWSSWSEWTSCVANCGIGSKTRCNM
uniref:Hemicentin-1 n=1 Tax=Ascaris lumbricoides TaxID=6252 RepID=A0A0M3IND8_ASCLU